MIDYAFDRFLRYDELVAKGVEVGLDETLERGIYGYTTD